MSIARHHAEWLALVEVSGPFLSLPALMQVFPQGLEAHDPERFRDLRLAFEEWEEQRADPAIHRAFARFVLMQALEFPPDAIVEGQKMPVGMEARIAEHGETVRPDWAIVTPPGLPDAGKPRLLIQIVAPDQSLEKPLAGKHWKASPATRMMELLHAANVPLGLLTNGEQWMLVYAPRGETTGFASWYASLWLEEKLTFRAFRSLLAVHRFFGAAEDATLEALFAASARNQHDVTDQLGLQVRKAVEVLIQKIDRLDQDSGRTLLRGVSEKDLYEAALTVMMRLVFLFSAEERGLLRLGDRMYDQNYAVSTLREALREAADRSGEEVLERRLDAWCRLLATFRAVFEGVEHPAMRLPAYGGRLFDPDRFPFLEGRKFPSWEGQGVGTRQPNQTPTPNPSPKERGERTPLPVGDRAVTFYKGAAESYPGQPCPDMVVRGTIQPQPCLDMVVRGTIQPQPCPDMVVRGTIQPQPCPDMAVRGTIQPQPCPDMAVRGTTIRQGRERNSLAIGDEAGSFQPLKIDNRAVLHLLEALQILQVRMPGGGAAEARRLSFRALDIEQIGHVYEGLLDHTAQRAATPMLGLIGTKDREPEIPLAELERMQERGADALVAYLREATGRSPKALRNAVTEPALRDESRLLTACGNDPELFRRVRPFAGLLRDDTFGYPVVIPTGSVFVTAGADRRSSGTHYTPRSLTEPIVQHALEPLVYVGPAEGEPKERWRLTSAKELLSLKVCDMAMGSGAFLVQACRYLAERLTEAWEDAEAAQPGAFVCTPEGELATGSAAERLIPADPEERLALARRYVADRCLYGVDKNPMAVEMAKLSLWLITLQKDRPFNFLDHALKCGDSLLGLSSLEQLQTFSLRKEAGRQGLILQFLHQEVEQAIDKRRRLESLPSDSLPQLIEKEALHRDAEDLTAKLRCAADMLIAAELAAGNAAAKEDARLQAHFAVVRHYHHEPLPLFQQLAQAHLRGQRPFHWPLEFPEIFEEGGFHAFIGNPPFVGGRRIRETLGDDYREFLNEIYPASSGNADLSAFFFLRAFGNLRDNGIFGLIATNTIAQGDTRQTGLDNIVAKGGTIFHATNNMPWPGMAAVFVSVVHIAHGRIQPPFILDDNTVINISTLLDSQQDSGEPKVLVANSGKSFQGSIVVGMGFVLLPEEAQHLLDRDPRNRDVIFPYLNGEDLNSRYDQSPSRWIINFFDWPLEKAETYTEPMGIVREKVYPVRAQVNREAHRKYWWHYGDKRPALYDTIASLKRVLVVALTSKYLCFSFVEPTWVYSHACGVITSEDNSDFVVLQSSFHDLWARTYGSTLETRLRYTPADCFETFPFPQLSSGVQHTLSVIGETYHEHRRQIMLTRQEGLTKTYNRFHSPVETAADIQRLRDLHVEMDRAVAAAYGWTDIDLGHDFHDTKQGTRFTVCDAARRELLDRLLRLNHERHAAELAQGARDPAKKRGKAPRKSAAQDPALF